MVHHFGATRTRTLCGLLYTPRLSVFHVWREWADQYDKAPLTVCPSCLKEARRWTRFQRDLMAIDAKRER